MIRKLSRRLFLRKAAEGAAVATAGLTVLHGKETAIQPGYLSKDQARNLLDITTHSDPPGTTRLLYPDGHQWLASGFIVPGTASAAWDPRCKYCGTWPEDDEETRCQSCGAPL